MFPSLPFPFEGDVFPRTLGAVVQRSVLNGEQPAREVVHADDGSWLVSDGVNDPNEPDAATVAHMWHVIELDSSVASLASLPPRQVATRSGPGAEWSIAPHEWPDDK
jgi:hypothetical protein